MQNQYREVRQTIYNITYRVKRRLTRKSSTKKTVSLDWNGFLKINYSY